ncbi:MAG: NAD(+)/NADH kinase [Dehalococcoidia bacterium]|nr:MAG: NAD(+)/NADH kinase [Dehalococcoidia bacterium]
MTFTVDGPVAVAYHPAVAGAEGVAQVLAAVASQGQRRAWVEPMHDGRDGDAGITDRLRGASLLVCVGGDGTVLRAAAFAAVAGVPIFGVRMGRLGFLTETIEPDAVVDLQRVLDGEARLERHAMLQARVDEAEPVHALNDVVIGRGTLGRTVSIGARVDGVLLAEYRADALVIATATGSTGYALSVGGPILPPTSSEIVMVPVAPHLTRANPLILPAGARLRLSVQRGEEAVITADGLLQWPVESGTVVEVTASARSVQFVRLGAENQFYASLARRLGWLRPDHVMEDPDGPAG